MYYLPVSHSQHRALAHYIITNPLLHPERLKPGLPIHLYVLGFWRFFKTTCKSNSKVNFTYRAIVQCKKKFLKYKTLKKNHIAQTLAWPQTYQCKELSFHALFIYWMDNSLSGRSEVRATQILTFFSDVLYI